MAYLHVRRARYSVRYSPCLRSSLGFWGAYPGQCSVGQPATSPALLKSGRQADIDNLEPAKPWPIIWLETTPSLPCLLFQHGLPRHPLHPLFEPLCAVSFAVVACLSQPLSCLSCLSRLSGLKRLSLLLNQPLRWLLPLTPQLSQSQLRSSAHARDDAAPGTATISGRPYHFQSGYPLHHAWKISPRANISYRQTGQTGHRIRTDGLFVPKPSTDADCQRRSISSLGQAVRGYPLASTAVRGDCHSLCHSAVHELLESGVLFVGAGKKILVL